MLALRQVSGGYGPIQVLRDVSLDVGANEIVCLLGSNGAGKTTTLLSILGLLRGQSGSITFDGAPILGRKTPEIVQRGIAIVPEGRRIFGPLTVAENLQIGGAMQHDAQEAAETLATVLDMFPILRDRYKQLAGTMSGGQQQMLAIGRALMTRPRLLLMDEPSMGLSPAMSEQVFDIIERVCARGVSILLVEQNAYATLAVASRGYVLQSGRIVLQGGADMLREAELIREAYL